MADRLNLELKKVLADPEVQAQLRKLGYTPGAYKSLDQLARFAPVEVTRWGRMIRSANLTAD